MTRTRPTFRSPEERLGRVRELINDLGSVRIDELANDFGVSEMTIRRDLDQLESLGLAHRVRGGAIAQGPEAWERRHQHNARAKGVIAEKLRPTLPSVGTIGVDASTTMFRLASSLEAARDLVVVTNGWDTFHAMTKTPGVTATLTGGTEEPRTGSLVGPMAVRTAESFAYDLFLTSSAALDPEFGPSEAAVAESEVKRAFARTADRIVLAVDHGKLGSRSQAKLLDLEQVDLLVTDLDPSDERLDPYRGRVDLM